ncbi:MAG TPA: FHA domain-containing protein [Pirellulales bacterium]|nr:FHA domain-containing protein [Pirellulales bacterium]
MAFVTLRILDGADRGRAFEDLPTPVTIGREEGNSIQLNDERVSRFHLKIQEDHDKVVLTDLESTNGTKVNGEEVQLRILRYGDLIAVGRSILLFGSREQIAARMARLSGSQTREPSTRGVEDHAVLASEELAESFDSGSNSDYQIQETMNALEPPQLPEHLSPAQAAQVCEIFGYFHHRIRDLLEAAKIKSPKDRVTVDFQQWQNLVDIQSRLADFLRSIGDPPDNDP